MSFIRSYISSDAAYEFENQPHLSNFRKINIFVGANNSGKSRFLRKIYTAQLSELVFHENVLPKLSAIYGVVSDYFGYIHTVKNLDELIKEGSSGNFNSRINSFIDLIEVQVKVRSTGYTPPGGHYGHKYEDDVAMEIKSKMTAAGIFKKANSDLDLKFTRIYIPILRGLRHLNSENRDHLGDRTKFDYELSAPEDISNGVFSGLSIYDEVRRMLLGTRQQRDFVRDFEKFLSESFFEGKEVSLVPDHDTSDVKLNIDGWKYDRQIQHLGDGIQSILIQMFRIFKHKNEKILLFIEEPEMLLHPAMQRIVIKTLLERFENLQVFATTHSNHFLDLTYDYPGKVSIFSFEGLGEEKFRINNITDNSVVANLLGVRVSSVFLSNSVIWVEGVSDRILLRTLISISNIPSKYLEDRHYAISEYGGSNLENFDFIGESSRGSKVQIGSISRCNLIIADNDAEFAGAKFKRREKLRQDLGETHFHDGYIEIENLFQYSVWRKVVEEILRRSEGKKIKLKDYNRKHEEDFNSKLKTEKIGKLLKKYLIESDVDGLEYFKANDVKCLGERKQVIAEIINEIILREKISVKDLMDDARLVLEKIRTFLDLVNE